MPHAVTLIRSGSLSLAICDLNGNVYVRVTSELLS